MLLLLGLAAAVVVLGLAGAAWCVWEAHRSREADTWLPPGPWYEIPKLPP
jgi:uncharacterized membrane protein